MNFVLGDKEPAEVANAFSKKPSLWIKKGSNSAGSLSPRTKFKELADYEFLLPPKSEQKRLAELLWAADEMIEKEKKELEKITELYEHKVDSLFSDKKKISFEECANINVKSLSAKTSSEYKFHYIDIASIICTNDFK